VQHTGCLVQGPLSFHLKQWQKKHSMSIATNVVTCSEYAVNMVVAACFAVLTFWSSSTSSALSASSTSSCALRNRSIVLIVHASENIGKYPNQDVLVLVLRAWRT
jgi:hypothetical protein